MSRYVWWSAVARRSIEALSPEHRVRFDAISAFLAVSPFPVSGSNLIKPWSLYTRVGFKCFNNDFPYTIYYRVSEEDEIIIDLVLRSFVS